MHALFVYVIFQESAAIASSETLYFALLTLFGLAFLTASYILFVVNEKQTKVRTKSLYFCKLATLKNNHYFYCQCVVLKAQGTCSKFFCLFLVQCSQNCHFMVQLCCTVHKNPYLIIQISSIIVSSCIFLFNNK